MVRLVIFVFTSICIGVGWSFGDRGPMPFDITTTGELLYPHSSGSNDVAVLSFGLLTFIVTAGYALISSALNHSIKYLVYVYLTNLAIFMFFVALVSLDSSFKTAAKLGDVLPLISVVSAFIPVPVLLLLHLANKSTWTK